VDLDSGDPDSCGPCGVYGSICYSAVGSTSGKCGDSIFCETATPCTQTPDCPSGYFCAEKTCCVPSTICVPIC